MTDIAYAPETIPGTVAQSRPRLEVVRNDVTTGSTAVDDHVIAETRAWRTAAVGAFIGFVVVTIVGTIAGTLAGFGAGGSIGMAVFVGAFGGIGFGFMMGGQIALGWPVAATQSTPSQPR